MIPFSYDIMQPMYPLLIQQFLDDYNLSAGVALDIGTGPGNLAVELAKVTAMDLILVDIDGEALHTDFLDISLKPKALRFFYPKGLRYRLKAE